MPWCLPLKETLLQSIGGVTVYHYCPWAVMTQIEGFAANGAGTRTVVDMGPQGEAAARREFMFKRLSHMCVYAEQHQKLNKSDVDQGGKGL